MALEYHYHFDLEYIFKMPFTCFIAHVEFLIPETEKKTVTSKEEVGELRDLLTYYKEGGKKCQN